jgi:DNA replication protein DnaC
MTAGAAPDCSNREDIFNRVYDRLQNPPPADVRRAEECRMREHEAANQVWRRRVEDFARSVGRRYHGCRFSTYEIQNDEQCRIATALREYAEDFPRHHKAGTGIVLFGPCGTGKDHLLAATAWEIIGRFRGVPTWVTGLDLFGRLRDGIGTNKPEADQLWPLITAPVLVLSDPLPPRGCLNEWQAGILLRIIDARYRNSLPTWASMNAANGDEAGDRMGAQAVDRLRHGAIAFFCNWPSYRTARQPGAAE